KSSELSTGGRSFVVGMWWLFCLVGGTDPHFWTPCLLRRVHCCCWLVKARFFQYGIVPSHSLSTLSVLTSSSARILPLFVIDRILNLFVRNRLRRILIYEFVFLVRYRDKKVKTQNESEADAAGNESEADAAGKGSSGKEGSKELELENKATLTTIVNTLDITSRKFDQVDSRLEAYELDRNRPLMDQKTIDDRASLVVRTHQKSVNSPALVDATPRNLRPLDFLVISPAKATKDDKSTKDDKAAKDPAYGYGCRRTRIVKGEEADEKKKAAQADAAFKRKEKVTPPRDGVTRCNVQPDVEDSSLADITNEVVAEQNEFAPESDVENSELVRSAIIKEFREKNVRLTPKGLSTMAVSSSFVFLTAIPPKPPAPPGKKEVLTADHEKKAKQKLSIPIKGYADCSWLFDDVREQCQCDTKLCKS
ncbi:BnaAnng11970D, partial [Brassica napus]